MLLLRSKILLEKLMLKVSFKKKCQNDSKKKKLFVKITI